MDIDKQMLDEDSKVTLTIRLIMQGKEVGSIIGKKGEIVKRFREESGAKINISDGSCPERIVTVTGTTNAIFKAFTLICKKFEEWCSQFGDMGGGGSGQNRPPITLRLIVPASQCGSLIGKGGSKIKEIRDVSGANIQVAGEMLPNSTERAVTISGSSDAITQCIYHICCVMLESPPKGATIPYRPKPQVGGPLILAGGQAYTIQGNYAVPAQDGGMYGVAIHPAGGAEMLMKGAPPAPPPHLLAALPPPHLVMPAPLPPAPHTAAQTHHQLHQLHHPYHHLNQEHMAMGALAKNPLAGLAALGLGGLNAGNAGGLNPAANVLTALAALAGSQLRTSQNRNQQPTNQTAHEMTVPNELIGCIIGKGGTKIAEIRQISGAMIRISNCEEREGGATDRTITISGNPDSVALAQYLINMSVELQKVNLGTQGNGENSGEGNSSGSSSAGPLASAIPLAQLLSKPGALNALSSLSALGGLSDLLGSGPIQTTGVHRSHRGGNRSRSPQNSSGDQPGKSKIERAKYNPY